MDLISYSFHRFQTYDQTKFLSKNDMCTQREGRRAYVTERSDNQADTIPYVPGLLDYKNSLGKKSALANRGP